MGFAGETINKKILALDVLYVIVNMLAILITWRGVQLFRFISMHGAWSAVVYVDEVNLKLI